MSKLIVEMEMPKDCPMCPMAHYNKLDEFTGCEVAAGKLFAATRDKAYAESASRPSWCPIVGVLPDEHGDLIDRDELRKMNVFSQEFNRYVVPMMYIEDANPIVAAERKDDEQL